MYSLWAQRFQPGINILLTSTVLRVNEMSTSRTTTYQDRVSESSAPRCAIDASDVLQLCDEHMHSSSSNEAGDELFREVCGDKIQTNCGDDDLNALGMQNSYC